MIEHERSYVFTYDGGLQFFRDHGLSLYFAKNDPFPGIKVIEDYYLSADVRIRKSWLQSEAAQPGLTSLVTQADGTKICSHSSNFRIGLPTDITYLYTRKTGDKSTGSREEFEECISDELAQSLIRDSKLCVKKIRKRLPLGGPDYVVTMDFIDEPMLLSVLEIESATGHAVDERMVADLFGEQLTECPLSAWDIFNRRIAFAGPPSSGKSETSKILSHILNTRFKSNSFHVSEFATTFIQKYQKPPSFWEEFFIWHGQREREHAVANRSPIMISDCPTFLTYIYLMHLPKEDFSPETALMSAKMYKRVLFDIDWYTDILFLRLREYHENNVRYQSGKEEALEIEQRMLQFLDDHRILYKAYDYTQLPEILRDLFYINGPLNVTI